MPEHVNHDYYERFPRTWQAVATMARQVAADCRRLARLAEAKAQGAYPVPFQVGYRAYGASVFIGALDVEAAVQTMVEHAARGEDLSVARVPVRAEDIRSRR